MYLINGYKLLEVYFFIQYQHLIGLTSPSLSQTIYKVSTYSIYTLKFHGYSLIPQNGRISIKVPIS